MFQYVNKEYDIDELNVHLKSDVEGFISECENFYSSQIQTACDRIISQNKMVILLSGPSGSGKTTTAEKIRDELIRRGKIAHVVSLDDFYLDRDELPFINGVRNAEVVEALDLDGIDRAMNDVIKSEDVYLPRYDFKAGARTNNAHKITVGKDGIVIFEDKISSLKRFKDDAKEVATGYECGIALERFNDIKEEDILEAYIMEEIKREL